MKNKKKKKKRSFIRIRVGVDALDVPTSTEFGEFLSRI